MKNFEMEDYEEHQISSKQGRQNEKDSHQLLHIYLALIQAHNHFAEMYFESEVSQEEAQKISYVIFLKYLVGELGIEMDKAKELVPKESFGLVVNKYNVNGGEVEN